MVNEKIRLLRERRDWSQDDLAREIGVNQSTISRIEAGGRISGPVQRIIDRLISETKEAA